jgi:phosphoglucomutase
MTAVTGRDPGELYRGLADELGNPAYERIDAPATPEQKAVLKRLSPEQVKVSTLGGEPITGMLTRAPGNNAYAESFRGSDHLHRIQAEAQALVEATFADPDR